MLYSVYCKLVREHSDIQNRLAVPQRFQPKADAFKYVFIEFLGMLYCMNS